MSRDVIIDSIKARLEELEYLNRKVSRSPALSVPGSLIVRDTPSNPRYYVREDNKEKYLKKGNEGTIKALSQKRFDLQLLIALEEEKEALNKCLGIIGCCPDPDSVYQSLEYPVRIHASEYRSSDDDYAKTWKAQSYYRAKRTESHKFETLGKNYVRSKSEVIIADRLHNQGIPYRYEERLILEYEGEMFRYYPDFTILNKRTRQIIYWEHLGMLGDEDYLISNLNKLDVYAHNDIISGKNLIVTCECSGKQLSTELVDLYIELLLK